VKGETQVDLSTHPLKAAVTAGINILNPVVTGITAVRGEKSLEADLLFADLSDLV
jgi:hypothetical protein